MNLSFGLLPSRSVLQLGLRAVCHNSSRSTIGAGSPRFLALCLISSQKRHSSHTVRKSWPSIPCRQTPSATGYRNQRGYHSRQVLSQYEDLPPDYQDRDGLPFRKTDLETPEVQAIFGSGIATVAANRLLRILHGRRVAGTLEDPELYRNTAEFSDTQKNKALEYLRKTVPADEIVNAGLRAEDELKELEQELSEGEKDHDGDGRQTVYKPDPVYGHSVIEAIRAKNEAEWEEELKRREEEKKQVEVAQPGTLMANPQRPKELSPRMQKWIENAGSKLEKPPEMSHVDRLLPSATLVFLFVGCCAAFAMVYKPPTIYDRVFPEISASHATVAALVAMNVLVWGLWRIPPFWGFMNRYFVLVHGMPKAVSVITSNFSHSSITHLLSNMVGLWLFGTLLHDEVGRGNFLALYLASGAIGLLGSLSVLTLTGRLAHSTLGASGAVYGITTAYFWMHRFDSFKILGLPPEPRDGPQGMAFLGLILAMHITLLLVTKNVTIDLWSHMTGMAAGLVGIEWVQRKNMREKEGEDTKVMKLVSVTEPKIEVNEKGEAS